MGNFSRNTFNQLKHYVGVRLQQGVPIVDADWNEMEDIRKYELRTFLKWFVGDGVPFGNNGFRISEAGAGVDNDFIIGGGDGTPEGAGRCLVDGMDVINESDLAYTAQPLFGDTVLADAWGVPALPALTTPGADRTDTVYLDVWEREVDATEDPDHLVNAIIGLETCVRTKREWVVRVAEGGPLPTVTPSHVFYPIATLERTGGNTRITDGDITDLRQTDVGYGNLSAEIADARGTRESLGNRLDQSLTQSGQLRQHIVGVDQFNSDLDARFGNLESHLTNMSNPHDVLPSQIGALALSDYDLSHSTWSSVTFTESDADGATRTVNAGFRPKFVWASNGCSAVIGGARQGATSSGFADLRGTLLQSCSFQRFYSISAAPYVTTNPALSLNLCSGYFREAGPPIRWVSTIISISSVSDSGLVVSLSRQGSDSTGTGDAETPLEFDIGILLMILG